MADATRYNNCLLSLSSTGNGPPQPPGTTVGGGGGAGTACTQAVAEAAELGDTQVSLAASKKLKTKQKKKGEMRERSMRRLTCIFSIISNKAEVWREESEMKCLSCCAGHSD